MQLLERLQKTESLLQKARQGEDVSEPVKEAQNAQVTLSPEVLAKLDQIDERMMELKRELHSAKQTCLKDLTLKFTSMLKSAQQTFAENELLS